VEHEPWLGGPMAFSVLKAIERHPGPDQLDDPQGPRPYQESIDAGEQAAAGEPKDVARITGLEPVHNHHEGHCQDTESGKHADSVTGPPRRCPICERSLAGRRSDAVTCSGTCRAELSRLRRILSGSGADGYAALVPRGSLGLVGAQNAPGEV